MADVHMSRKAFIKEHEDLTKVLKNRDPKGLKREYKEQSAELRAIKRRAKNAS